MTDVNNVSTYKFLKDCEYPAEHALSGNHKEGEEVTLAKEVAEEFVADNVLVAVEQE